MVRKEICILNFKKRLIISIALTACALGAHATLWDFTINASGNQVVPPSGSPGTGPGTLHYNDVTNQFQLNMTMAGISAQNTTQITGTKLYLGAPGVAGSLIDDLSVLCNWNGSNGNYGLFAPVFYNFNQQFEQDLINGNVYLQVHTSQFGNGEIRGNFTSVPEPSTVALVVLGSLGLMLRRRKKSV